MRTPELLRFVGAVAIVEIGAVRELISGEREDRVVSDHRTPLVGPGSIGGVEYTALIVRNNVFVKRDLAVGIPTTPQYMNRVQAQRTLGGRGRQPYIRSLVGNLFARRFGRRTAPYLRPDNQTHNCKT